MNYVPLQLPYFLYCACTRFFVYKLTLNVSWKQNYFSDKQNILTEFSIMVSKMRQRNNHRGRTGNKTVEFRPCVLVGIRLTVNTVQHPQCLFIRPNSLAVESVHK